MTDLLATRRQVVELAYSVDDLAEGMREWEPRGAGPFTVYEHVPVAEAWHGEDAATYTHSMALAAWGGVVVELIQLHDVRPAPLRDAFAGTGRLHHVAWFVDDLDEEGQRLEAAGCPRVLDATVVDGPRFTFHALPGTGHHLELFEPVGAISAIFRSVLRSGERVTR